MVPRKKLILEIEIPDGKKNSDIKNNKKNLGFFVSYISSFDRIFILSPHLDDAVLSMGSLISFLATQKVQQRVITLFSASQLGSSNAIRSLLKNANFKNSLAYFKARKKEDIVALRSLGVTEITHLNYIDSAWRRSKAGIPLYPDSQLSIISEEDSSLIEKLKVDLNSYFQLIGKVLLFAPLAQGKHVDHQITRYIAGQLSRNVIYYRDFPYSNFYENEVSFIRSNNLVSLDWNGDYWNKKSAILKYETQQYSLFYQGPMKLPLERFFYNKNIKRYFKSEL